MAATEDLACDTATCMPSEEAGNRMGFIRFGWDFPERKNMRRVISRTAVAQKIFEKSFRMRSFGSFFAAHGMRAAKNPGRVINDPPCRYLHRKQSG